MEKSYIPPQAIPDTTLDRECPSCGAPLEVDCEPYSKMIINCTHCEYTEKFGTYSAL